MKFNNASKIAVAGVMALGVTVAVSTFASDDLGENAPGVYDSSDQAIGPEPQGVDSTGASSAQSNNPQDVDGKATVPIAGPDGAEATAVAGEIIAEIPDPQKAAQLGSRVTPTGIPNTYRIAIPVNQNPETAAKALSLSAGVTSAEPNVVTSTSVRPNDPMYKRQWNFRNIDAPAGWNVSRGNKKVIVAVLDSGINLDHNDLKGKGWVNPQGKHGFNALHPEQGVNDECGHGTAVSSLIASETNNHVGLAGLNWETKIMPIKVLGSAKVPFECHGTWLGLAQGIRYAADHHADIINMSLEGPDIGTSAVKQALHYAHKKGVVLIAASGNYGWRNKISFPASYPDVIAVGAVDMKGHRKNYSDGGKQLSVVAPSGVTGAYYQKYKGKWAYITHLEGTSFAAPEVAGLASLMLSVKPDLNSGQVRQIIEMSAKKNGHKRNDLYGHGLINVQKALQNVQSRKQQSK